ncbi:hypothetical protein F6X86_00590 [Enterococcus durans]|uniref:Uncharacterized protein n=1 Tax=Enterococcus durans TaxID=53345 RepID=A0A5N0YVY9_9ENTE|nr:hypothetical protein F6X86_00590 [Enterococcus durans]TKN17000.1 hypothetical protein DVW83_09360 [Enterococcus sp. VV15]KAA9188958.1 hypothetical protein F6X85_01300 [Enterococcus durans]KAA9196013.1 hypothetical protein F6X88_01300 [Enterococcus durans]KAA9200989.1 hypothetical protein F6X91_01300 [Enterococcus durans]
MNYLQRDRDKSRLGLKNWRKKRLGQKCLTPRNKPKFTKIVFQIFVNFSLFKKELLLLPPFIRF